MSHQRKHPAEVTAERLLMALDKWPDAFDGEERDMIGRLIDKFDRIAAGETVDA